MSLSRRNSCSHDRLCESSMVDGSHPYTLELESSSILRFPSIIGVTFIYDPINEERLPLKRNSLSCGSSLLSLLLSCLFVHKAFRNFGQRNVRFFLLTKNFFEDVGRFVVT